MMHSPHQIARTGESATSTRLAEPSAGNGQRSHASRRSHVRPAEKSAVVTTLVNNEIASECPTPVRSQRTGYFRSVWPNRANRRPRVPGSRGRWERRCSLFHRYPKIEKASPWVRSLARPTLPRIRLFEQRYICSQSPRASRTGSAWPPFQKSTLLNCRLSLIEQS